ncbi:NYN domain-containing protein [Adlercreutzia sp. ZJ473]|uniref:NYN domain-containing protein n=1 Tax=Adlercreutzia sp. ZJ473 TaxID=2722822 RepID=UPI00155642B4|nr:NYN domain-containing protein [Adlercreutzia sp. ZJ473]
MEIKTSSDKRFALLIDADNVSARYIKPILNELSKYGTVTIKRIYGDWTLTLHAKWKDALLENSITPIQQFGYTQGKNATDSAMIIDAMDILYTESVDGFCIVSSDSDFTRLASRLRESGRTVIGMGEKKTPTPFRRACDVFTTLELLIDRRGKSGNANGPAMSKDEVEQAVVDIITDNQNNGKSTGLGEVGSRLLKRYPDFDVRSYGTNLLSKLLSEFTRVRITKDHSSVTVELTEGGEDKREEKAAKADERREDKAAKAEDRRDEKRPRRSSKTSKAASQQAAEEAAAAKPEEGEGAGEVAAEAVGAAAEKGAEKIAEKVAGTLEEKTGEKPAEKAAGAPADRNGEKPVEKAVGTPADRSGEKPTEKPAAPKRSRRGHRVSAKAAAKVEKPEAAPDMTEPAATPAAELATTASESTAPTSGPTTSAVELTTPAPEPTSAKPKSPAKATRKSPAKAAPQLAAEAAPQPTPLETAPAPSAEAAPAPKPAAEADSPAPAKKPARKSRRRSGKKTTAASETPQDYIRQLVRESGATGIELAQISESVRAKFKDFKVRDLGFSQLRQYVSSIDDFSIEKIGKSIIVKLAE